MAPSPKIFQTGAMKNEAGQSVATATTDTFTSVFGTDVITLNSDLSLSTGDAVRVTGADLPDPLVTATEYFWIEITSVTGMFADTYANAIAGTQINLTDDGTPPHTATVWAITSEWGGSGGVQTLGANDAFPHLSFGNKLNVDTEEDESVTTKAFASTPRMIGKNVDNPVSFPARYKSMNRFYYWMFGFENVVRSVVVVRAGTDPFSSAPAIGDACEDHTPVTPLTFTFLRTEVTRSETLYIFEALDSAPPVGDIDGTGGASWVMTTTSTSAVMYEHLYELDGIGRRLRPYTVAERLVFNTVAAGTLFSTDRRNLQATFGKRMDQYDLRYQNSMCKNFGLKLAAAGTAVWESNYMGYTEERDDYDSANWSLLAGLSDGTLKPAHMEYKFLIGTTISEGTDGVVSGLTEYGMSDINLEVQTPLQAIQTTVSGLSFAEPVLDGNYGLNMTGTIGRHSTEALQTVRDAQTLQRLHLIANQGNYMQEIMVKEATISEAGPDDGSVAAEPLNMPIGYVEGSNQWSTFLEGYTELQDSPILMRVRDDSSVNEMTRV